LGTSAGYHDTRYDDKFDYFTAREVRDYAVSMAHAIFILKNNSIFGVRDCVVV